MIRLICTGCNREPAEIEEYIEMAAEVEITPDEWAWEEEGTLNKTNGHFLCTDCYIKAGMPTSPGIGWKAP